MTAKLLICLAIVLGSSVVAAAPAGADPSAGQSDWAVSPFMRPR